MTHSDQFIRKLQSYCGLEALVCRNATFRYDDVDRRLGEWQEILQAKEVKSGAVVGIKADYSLRSISLLLALLAQRCIAAMVPQVADTDDAYVQDGQLEALVRFSGEGEWTWQSYPKPADHSLILRLRESATPGFIVFSSGSTGRPKAILHSLERFLLKYDKPGKRMRTIAFLLYDHIAGIDTLFYTLSSGGVLIAPDRRDPRSICRLIESCRAEVLPTSPTFLNLLSISGEYADFDLSSLKIVTYGSEPMNQSTLDRVQRVFSSAQILQKYGTSEFGSPRSRSRGRDSLWLEFDADGMQTRVINGMLQVKSDTAMLGYLNAPSPFDEEGWYRTGDIVECEGDWVHIRGRECEIINVGGEKVYPQEVEAVILELEFVKDAIVRGKSNPITGQIVTAEINVRRSIDEQVAWREVRKHCRARLAPHKVPVRVMLSEEALTTDRQKKIRHERPK